MIITRRALRASCALVALSLGATPALAQEAGVTGADDIVVTARRVSESAQSVPIAIEAFSQKDLTARAITSAGDLGKSVAGLSTTADSGNPALQKFAIRGRGQNFGAASGSVETYFADVPLSPPFQMPGFQPQFFDISAFQVLKGPQGTLFGRNTTAGAVVIVPQAPKLGVTEGYVRVQGGSYSNFQIEGAVNIPLGDKVALRLAAFDWQRRGYLHSSATDILTGGGVQMDNTTNTPLGAQTFNNVNQTQFRASLTAELTDSLTNTTVASYEVEKSRSSALGGLMQGARVAPTASNPFGVVILAIPTCGKYCGYIDVNLTKPATRNYFVANTTSLSVNEAINFKNIAGYIHSDGYTNHATNADGFSLALIDLPLPARAPRSSQFTDEFQISGKTGVVSYLVGAMLDKSIESKNINQLNIFSVSYSGAASGFQNAVNFQSTNITQKSLFGSLTITPLPELNLTGGFRQSWVDLSQTQGNNKYAAGSTPSSAPTAASLLQKQTKFSGSTYNLGVDYHVNSDLMVYGGFRHGWKRGGFNPSQPDNSSFGPEKVDSWNLGVKESFNAGGIRGHVNVELFYDTYKGMQVSYLAFGANQLITNTVNIQKTNYKGIDADLGLMPTPWLDLGVSWVYNDAKIKSFTVTGDTKDLSINHVPFAPKNKLSAYGRLHGEVGIGELALSGYLNYSSKVYDNVFNIAAPTASVAAFGVDNVSGLCLANGQCSDTINALTTVDARLELNHAFGSRFDLAAGVTNLTNKFYYTGSGATFNFGVEGFAIGAPRMWTVEVRTKF
jgi:iron complex outermembrane receptor protein